MSMVFTRWKSWSMLELEEISLYEFLYPLKRQYCFSSNRDCCCSNILINFISQLTEAEVNYDSRFQQDSAHS